MKTPRKTRPQMPIYICAEFNVRSRIFSTKCRVYGNWRCHATNQRFIVLTWTLTLWNIHLWNIGCWWVKLVLARGCKSAWRCRTHSLNLWLLLVLNRFFPLHRRTSIRSIEIHRCFKHSQRLIHTCAVTARPVYRALLPVRMLEIELYQISLSPGRGRSGFEIRISNSE